MFVLVATVLTLVVIMLAWRGMGNGAGTQPGQQPPEPRGQRRPVRSTAPDDDPDFLREIDRKLRGEDKSG